MENKLLNATVKATGNKVQVYKLKKGGYAEYPNCTKEYKDDELNFNN